MFRPMKASTVLRRAEERKKARAQSTLELIARLYRKVEEEGSDSIWAEMLTEAVARQEANRSMQ